MTVMCAQKVSRQEHTMPVPAIKHPSTSLCGSWRMISRSLHVPGSDSSALTTRYDGLPSDSLGMKDHFSPDGKPAPPRPRRPDCFIWSTIHSLPLSRRSFVLDNRKTL